MSLIVHDDFDFSVLHYSHTGVSRAKIDSDDCESISILLTSRIELVDPHTITKVLF